MQNKRYRIHAKKKNKGFTLLELIIVMFLITLILGISTIFFAHTISSSKFNTTVKDISTTIRYARTLAKIHGKKQIVTIDLDKKKYGIEGKKTRTIPSDIQVKIIDPFWGEVIEGKYQLISNTRGGIEGGTIVLWNDNKKVSIQMDPIVGTIVIK